jgi:DNA polymerase I-like protein with 3'-5' exonuclease and polymerase domains
LIDDYRDPGVRTLDQLDQVVEAYLDFDEFCFDVETKGPYPLDPQRNEVFWVSLAGPGRADVIPCGHPVGERVIYDDDIHRINPNTKKHEEHRTNPESGRLKWFPVPEPFHPAPKQLWASDVFAALRPLMFSERRKIGHNVKFDLCSVAKYYDGEVPPPPYGDTLVAARVADERHNAYRLGDCIKRAFRYSYAKIGKAGPENFPFSEAYLYSFLDAKYTWLLWRHLTERLGRQRLGHILDLEADLLPGIIDMEMTGIAVDLLSLQQLDAEYTLEIERLKLKIDAEAGWEINLNATLQVAHYLYDIMRYPCFDYTHKTGARRVNIEVLERHRKDARVAHILEHKQLTKIKSTFLAALKTRTVNGRVHPNFHQLGAKSGRMSCSDPNIQQIPSRTENGRKVRDLFISSAPSKVLIVSDLSQIELRILAHFTQDPVLLSAYQEGLDLHGILAERVFGQKFSPQQRILAKNGNFATLYGAGPKTLVARYAFPNVTTAAKVQRAFYDTYQRVQPWKDKVLRQCRETYRPPKGMPYVTTILGRKCRVPGLLATDDNLVWGAERRAISVRIQGTAADLFKLAMIQCYDRLCAQDYEAHMLMVVHDELVVEAPYRQAEHCLDLVKTAMEDVDNPFTGRPILKGVPIVADAKIVSRWSDK